MVSFTPPYLWFSRETVFQLICKSLFLRIGNRLSQLVTVESGGRIKV